MAAVGTGTATGLGTTTVPTTSMPTPLPTPVATSQPVGSSVFLALALTTLSLLVLLLLRHYLPLRSTPAFLLVPVFFAIFLPASLVLLVPIDLGSTLAYIHASHGTTISPRHLAEGGAAPPPHVHHNSAVWLPERAVLVMWRIAYWLIFALTWLILPFLSEYLDAYHPTGRARALASLRANARYYLSLLALGCAGLAYVAVSYGLRPASLRSLVMALAYVWGLALAIYLMGHGLVAVPRHCWRKRSYPAHLRRLQTRAVSVWDQLVDSRTDCAEIERVVALVAERKGSVVSVGDSQRPRRRRWRPPDDWD
ncbi:hypothetical protein KEM52_002370 [Ascosphaera acerosa]|nr:hypothetical protein KEM52_002370 [Ascosphaera acerosa]